MIIRRFKVRDNSVICPCTRSPRVGAVAVEFAISFVILLLLVFGGIEFYRVSMLRHSANQSAYVAARTAMIPGANAADAQLAATNVLNAVGVVGATITISPNPIAENTKQVDVTVSLPIPENSWIAPRFLFGSLEGQCSLLTERAPIVMSHGLPEPPPPPPPPPGPEPDPVPEPTPDPGPAPDPGPPPPPLPPPMI